LPSVRSGLPDLDRFLGGFQLGDNVVWVAEAGTFVNVFVSEFVSARSECLTDTVIYVNANHAPQNIFRRYAERNPGCNVVHVDAFTHGKGRGDPIFRDFYRTERDETGFQSLCVENPSNAEAFNGILSSIEDRYGERVRYVFNSLTGFSELWGGERAVQEFFTHHCPKLYELQTVAYWVLEKEAHSKPFLANLSHITQVVIQLQNRGEEFCAMKFLKAEDRSSSILNEVLRYRVAEDRIEFPGQPPERSLHVGTRIRELRMERDLTQAELARRLDITPSALCQIENNQVYPSLPLVLDLSRQLDCPLDALFPGKPPGRGEQGGWLVFKKKDQEPPGRKKNALPALEARPLLPDSRMGKGLTPYLVRLEKGAEGNRAFFDHKGAEFGWVASGMLKIHLPGEEVILRRGDSIFLEGQAMRRWRVEGNSRCELLWILA
jgi:transcriptional regulator with XRE-family HTH domain